MLIEAADEEVRQAAFQNLFEEALKCQATHVARRSKGHGALGQHVGAAGGQLHGAAAGVQRGILVAFRLANHGCGKAVGIIAGDAGRKKAPRPRGVRDWAKERPHEHDLDVVATAVRRDGLCDVGRLAIAVHRHEHDFFAVLLVDEVVVGAQVVNIVEKPLPRIAADWAARPNGNLRRPYTLLAERMPLLVEHLNGSEHGKVGVVGVNRPVGDIADNVVKARGREPGSD